MQPILDSLYHSYQTATGYVMQVSDDVHTLLETEKASARAQNLYTQYSTQLATHTITGIRIPLADMLYAHAADIAYMARDSIPHELIGSDAQIYIYDHDLSDEQVCIYISHITHTALIAYRGTVATQLSDIASDLQIVLDMQGVDPRITSSLYIYDAVRRGYEGYAIHICGHSLGGTIAYIVAKHRYPARCVVFNPGASMTMFFVQAVKDSYTKNNRTDCITTYKIA
jgi:hypothetical protein